VRHFVAGMPARRARVEALNAPARGCADGVKTFPFYLHMMWPFIRPEGPISTARFLVDV
jgi:hypothetical protein